PGRARAGELQALRELGTLEQTEPREGDEAARDELTRRTGLYVQKDVDAWLAHVLAAHRGHYADPAARAAAADLLPTHLLATHLLAHAALLTELTHLALGAGVDQLAFDVTSPVRAEARNARFTLFTCEPMRPFPQADAFPGGDL
ncbi:hypothetical protein, partial [Streptomyces sp. NPDC052015]|uniref:hypothetical protein n=1 Tax=Streptomyces sp. NPDC052015 TaxID=3154755 RepID=UPI00344A7601